MFVYLIVGRLFIRYNDMYFTIILWDDCWILYNDYYDYYEEIELLMIDHIVSKRKEEKVYKILL